MVELNPSGKTPSAILRTVGLLVLIVADAAMLLTLLLTGNVIWFGVFLLITLLIVAAEVYGLTVGFKQEDGSLKKMTISTAYKLYIMRVGTIGFLPLALFLIAMIGLVVHLAFW